jgi:hypothetical protein
VGPILFAAVLGTLHLDVEVPKAGGDYLVVPFEVPAGTVELEVARTVPGGDVVLDFGVWGPGGFRGWGGGLTEPTTIGVSESSRGYLPGPIAQGTWQLVVGKARIPSTGASFSADLTFRDAATLAVRARADAAAGPTLARGARWYRGDLHVHSSESGDASAGFDEIVALARARGLDFVVLSDHNTVAQHALAAAVQSATPDVLLMRGNEVTTYAGHGNAVGAAAYVDHRVGLDGRTAAAIVREVKAQGGIFIVNHPSLDLGTACIGCAWRHGDTPWEDVGAIELQTGNYTVGVRLFLEPTLALWDERLDAGARIAAVGGSDDHRAGRDTGSTASAIGSPTTLVWAEELSEAAILDGIRAGRTMVALRGPDDPLVELSAGGARIGDTVTARGGAVDVEAHVVGGSGARLELVGAHGERLAEAVEIAADDVRVTVPVRVGESGGRVRAQLSIDGDPVVITSPLWIAYAPGGCATVPGGGDAGAMVILVAASIVVGARARRRRR